MKERITWIDSAKGFGMLLVMFAHAPISSVIVKLIYAFHMPLFFFISGYLFSSDKYPGWTNFIKSKFKTLLVPFFAFSLVNSLFWLVFRSYSNHSDISIYKPFLGIFTAIRGTEWTLSQAELWFVAALFITELMFYLILRITKDIKHLIIILICYSIIGYTYSKLIHVNLPWSIDAACVGITFFGVGYLVKKKAILEINKYSSLGKLFGLIILWIIPALLNGDVNMFCSTYGNYFLFYISALSGIAAVIILFKKINAMKLINYIGKNTIIFLSLHNYIIFSVLNRLFSSTIDKSTGNFYMMNSIGLLYVIIATIILIPTSYIINSYFPFIIGRSKQKQHYYEGVV